MFVLPFKTRVSIPENNNSYLIFKYEGLKSRIGESRGSYQYILKAILRYRDGYATSAYDLMPGNGYWRDFYSNPEDLPFDMRSHSVSAFVNFTESCEYYIPIPTGQYNIEFEFYSNGIQGQLRRAFDVKDQNSLYLKFSEYLRDGRMGIDVIQSPTKSKEGNTKCVYRD